ncbi:DNA translocase FtsK, partial [Escherichia coli]|nr:DNA translocase FtsK [Escherichia coli]
ELIEPTLPDYTGEPISEERIKARIADVIRSRVGQGSGAQPSEPAVAGQRREPVINSAVSAAIARRKGAPEPLVAAPRMTPPPQPLAAELEEQIDVFEPELIEPEPAAFDAPAPAAPRKVVQHPVKKPVQPSRQAQAEAQPALKFDDQAEAYEHPPLSLLTNP